MIYDSLLVECDGPIPLEGLALVEKKLPRWQDNVFMLVREAAQMTSDLVQKPAVGKHMCIISALMNVGSVKVQRAVAGFTMSGPHAYMTIQQLLVAKRSGQYLQVCSLTELTDAAPGNAFLVHHSGHSVGVLVQEDGKAMVSDSSYPNIISIRQHDFCAILQQFHEDDGDTMLAVFKLKPATSPAISTTSCST